MYLTQWKRQLETEAIVKISSPPQYYFEFIKYSNSCFGYYNLIPVYTHCINKIAKGIPMKM
jgi:hypothetical protein